MNSKLRPADLFQDAILIFTDYWILLARNYIPFSCSPLYLYIPSFLLRSVSCFYPLTLKFWLIFVICQDQNDPVSFTAFAVM